MSSNSGRTHCYEIGLLLGLTRSSGSTLDCQPLVPGSISTSGQVGNVFNLLSRCLAALPHPFTALNCAELWILKDQSIHPASILRPFEKEKWSKIVTALWASYVAQNEHLAG